MERKFIENSMGGRIVDDTHMKIKKVSRKPASSKIEKKKPPNVGGFF